MNVKLKNEGGVKERKKKKELKLKRGNIFLSDIGMAWY